jgi:hypothetical protein
MIPHGHGASSICCELQFRLLRANAFALLLTNDATQAGIFQPVAY